MTRGALKLRDLFIPKAKRKARCEAAGTHRPVIIDASRKLCMECGTW